MAGIVMVSIHDL